MWIIWTKFGEKSNLFLSLAEKNRLTYSHVKNTQNKGWMCKKLDENDTKSKICGKSMIRSFVTHIIFNRAFHTLVDVIIYFVLKPHSAIV